MFFHVYFWAAAAAQELAKAQYQKREQENARRRAVGLPPLPPVTEPIISEKEKRERRREDIKCEVVFWSMIVFFGLIFTAPFAALLYVVIKLVFVKNGIDFP